MEHAEAVGGVELCYELLGAPADPVVVLIAGLGRQLIGWDDGFCDLARGRGASGCCASTTGTPDCSTPCDDGPPFDLAAARAGGADAVAYTLEDMADDTAGLLDAARHRDRPTWWDVHGGMIAQTLAVRHPVACAQPVLDHVEHRRRPTWAGPPPRPWPW